MQSMDCHTRQINQHIEYEADWENGFNLHMKLAPVIQLLLNWCSRDKVIFIKAYRMLLKKLQEELGTEGFNLHPVGRQDRLLFGHSFKCAFHLERSSSG